MMLACPVVLRDQADLRNPLIPRRGANDSGDGFFESWQCVTQR
jgi:hypothetical protein